MKFSKEQVAIIQKVANYIVSLPEGTNMTIWQAMADVIPELRDEARRYDNKFMGILFLVWSDAIRNEVAQQGRTLDYSEHDGKLEGLLQNLDFILR